MRKSGSLVSCRVSGGVSSGSLQDEEACIDVGCDECRTNVSQCLRGRVSDLRAHLGDQRPQFRTQILDRQPSRPASQDDEGFGSLTRCSGDVRPNELDNGVQWLRRGGRGEGYSAQCSADGSRNAMRAGVGVLLPDEVVRSIRSEASLGVEGAIHGVGSGDGELLRKVKVPVSDAIWVEKGRRTDHVLH